ncbi:MAG: outer membrane protein assembly factor BamD [Candidatus Puniceispirillaceae bacterium]
MTQNRLLPITLSVCCLLLAGCVNSTQYDTLEQVEQPVDTLYNEALDTVLTGDIEKAGAQFEEVERQHPYSAWAVRAQVMAAWSFYQANQYSDAVNALDRFIELYPAHSYTEYAYYLRALCFYEQIVDVERDADMTRRALEAFEDLIRRYPEGTYARDSQLKLDLTRSHLAGKEMAVGRFYLEKGHFNAAIQRFEVVITQFDTTSQVPEALYRLSEAYLSLGLIDEAERVGAVALYNYPNSVWTERLLVLVDDPTRPGPKSLLETLTDTTLNLFN